MNTFIKLLAFFLLNSVANAADAEYNVMIAYHSDQELEPCSEWADMIDTYMTNRASTYIQRFVGTIEWRYENEEVDPVRTLRGSRELCGHCNLCRDWGFKYCNAMYWCQGCRRRNLAEGEVDDRDLDYLLTAAKRIKAGCKTILNRAGAGAYPGANLSGECMDVLADPSTDCEAVVERI